jgi:DNA-binding NtrC family response regulator
LNKVIFMPAPVVVVHQQLETLNMLMATIRAAGFEVTGFADPLKALDAIENGSRARVLVTRLDFGPGKLNGIALARMLRHKGLGVEVVFVGRADKARYLDSTEAFVPHPVDPEAVADAVRQALTTSVQNEAALPPKLPL